MGSWVSVNHTITLYRPVGPQELKLIKESNFKRFPPRLSWQPIFYPVLNLEYAKELTKKWNVQDHGEGHVVSFVLPTSAIDAYERRTVGSRTHEELWIPAEELPMINDAIIGEIEIVYTVLGSKT